MVGFLSLEILGKSSMLVETPDEGRMQSMKTSAFFFSFYLELRGFIDESLDASRAYYDLRLVPFVPLTPK